MYLYGLLLNWLNFLVIFREFKFYGVNFLKVSDFDFDVENILMNYNVIKW